MNPKVKLIAMKFKVNLGIHVNFINSNNRKDISAIVATPKIAPASLWNRKDIIDFKAQIKKEGPEGIIKVGHGETVTVRIHSLHKFIVP